MQTYLIDTPPPTISGNLHIGHIFSYTQGDIAARYQKYLATLETIQIIYPFCFDNNGIPTGKLAANKGIRNPEEIIKFSIEKSKEYLSEFNSAGIQFTSASYYTYSEQAVLVAYQAFEYLKSTGIAYKAETEYLWSEKLQTSISQSELDDNGLIERTGETPLIKKGIGWFINIKDHLPDIQNKINQIDWKPAMYKKRADAWLEQIEWDWSISRERNFGIPIPGEEGMTFDTWFISALTPQLAWSAHNDEPSLSCPIFDIRFQSHDIIRTWAFYTITMSHFLNDQIPWKTILITGHTLDGKGNKFSKSAGNATPPKPFVEKYGANGIRAWAVSGLLGTDTKIDENAMKMGWRIRNKFLNARKFIQKQLENLVITDDIDYEIIDSYREQKKDILAAFDEYDYHAANELIYKLIWTEFCDKWIEYSKVLPIPQTLKAILDDFEHIFNIIYGDE